MLRTPTCVLTSATEPQAVHGHSPHRFVQIGSLTKVLTGTALIRMSEAGALDIDDPLDRWLKVPRDTGITLRHLAHHTSGLPRQPPGLPRRNPYLSFDDAALHSLLAQADRLTIRPAGQDRGYSNLGYAVLGAALSKAAKAPYEEVVRDYVLDPLGIREIASRPPEERRLYATGFLGRRLKPWTVSGAILPAGGMWATPQASADLVRKLLVDQKLGEPAPTWQTVGKVTWHTGATHNASVFAGALTNGAWVLVHRLGGAMADTDRMGAQLLARLGKE
ncbi:serine hydrolase [Streptomyces sp. UNOC14_S4]|uniref:serine hydrolase domain-containing protein n=1 Tax=Streptomyces sp. UNOC14_S4 TaxID=2872340 RepID=UPI001E59ED55|nr:serine hydrolase domain-containing protein [Streptomyces sp. UNOC14_S4]MCC3768927.1 beta-lactamase family protein [Streptomyces sp. UNOC14_S4]